jgi:hypothetical protein
MGMADGSLELMEKDCVTWARSKLLVKVQHTWDDKEGASRDDRKLTGW